MCSVENRVVDVLLVHMDIHVLGERAIRSMNFHEWDSNC